MEALLYACLLLLVAGCAALALSPWPRAATVVGAGGCVLGCLWGLWIVLFDAERLIDTPLSLPWDAAHGGFCVDLDDLSRFFLLAVLGLSAVTAVYGGRYLLDYRDRKALGPPWFFFNLFVAAMVLVLIARSTLLFLMAWEVMSLAAWPLVTFEREKAEVRRAGWIYLIATHLGMACLVPAFVLLSRGDGVTFSHPPVLGAGVAGLAFVLALVGFGAKAGLVPFHVWLPEAHPAAPSHVSALMSGVMIKLGLYGILRVFVILADERQAWWGLTLAALGLVTALVGVALAGTQRDIKRMLAYSSIEHVGLIALALGVGLWAGGFDQGKNSERWGAATLLMTAGLVHIWNHALMKGLMFLAAGSVLHGAGTRDMEQLGGLAKRMPWTAAAFLVGAVAVAALPPLNGFVGKWMLYVGLLQVGLATGDGTSLAALFAAGLLALIGTLAAAAFVRLTGIVLLGSPRSAAARHAHESSPWLVVPMFCLVGLCLAAALLPRRIIGLMDDPLDTLFGPSSTVTWTGSNEVPLPRLATLNLVLLGASAGLTALFVLWARRTRQPEAPTWGCGYARPTARMQYTGRSFAELLTESLLPAFLRPTTKRKPPRGLFPGPADFGTEVPDPFEDRVYTPFFGRWGEWLNRLRILQQGSVNAYLLYILVAVVLALGWVSLRAWWVQLPGQGGTPPV